MKYIKRMCVCVFLYIHTVRIQVRALCVLSSIYCQYSRPKVT